MVLNVVFMQQLTRKREFIQIARLWVPPPQVHKDVGGMSVGGSMLGSPAISRYHSSLPESLDPQIEGLPCYSDRILTHFCPKVTENLSYITEIELLKSVNYAQCADSTFKERYVWNRP